MSQRRRGRRTRESNQTGRPGTPRPGSVRPQPAAEAATGGATPGEQVEAAPRQTAPSPAAAAAGAGLATSKRSGPSRLLIGLIAFFAISAALIGLAGVSQIANGWKLRTDLFVFYDAADVITGTYKTHLYDTNKEYWASTPAVTPPKSVGNFFNPPLVALLFRPLSGLEFQTAKEIFMGLSVAAALFLVSLVSFWAPKGREKLYMLITALALAGFWPLYMGLWFGQPAVLYAGLSGLALVELEMAAPVSAGGYIGLLALKPSLFTAPLGLLLWRRRYKSAAAAIGLALVLALFPFVFLGGHSLQDFRALTSDLTAASFKLQTEVTTGADGLLNWNGFWASLFKTDPPYAVIIPLDLLTVAVMLKVWHSGTLREAWLAGMAALTLTLPHLLAYDWVLLFPAAVAVACERPSRSLLGLLVLVHGLVNFSVLQQVWVSQQVGVHHLGGFWAVPGLFGLIVFLAWRPQAEALIERLLNRGRASPAPATNAVRP